MEWIWWGIIILILIIIGVVITILVLNRGNALDIINSLPSYRIYSPTDNVYMGVLNIIQIDNVGDGNLPVYFTSNNVPQGDKIWTPVINTSINASLNYWSFEPVTGSFTNLQPNQRMVKLINRVYEATNIGYEPACTSNNGNTCNRPTATPTGFVRVGVAPLFIPPSTTQRVRLLPDATVTTAEPFLYTDLGDNKFTLITSGGRNVSLDEGGPFVKLSGAPAAIWQLLPLN